MALLQVIAIEISKWKHNALFRLLMLSYLILTPTVIFTGKMISDIPPLPSTQTMFSFPGVWHFQGYIGSWIAFFILGYFAVYMITSEVEWKTQRQSILHGLTRNSYFSNKVGFITLLSSLATIWYSLSCILIGTFHDSTSMDSTAFYVTDFAPIRYFLMVMSYMSFGLFIGFIVKKSGLSMFAYFGYIIFLEPLLRWSFHYRIFGGNSHNYYPMNVVEDLMPNPLYKVAAEMGIELGDSNSAIGLLKTFETVLISPAYVCVFILTAWFVFKRNDL